MTSHARRSSAVVAAMTLAIALAGCGTSRDEQYAEQAEAAAARAQASATRAEDAANRALEAANKATEAADRATKVVEEATKEINRVADHLDELIKERDAREHAHRSSHVKAKAGVTESRGSPTRAAAPEATASPAR